MWRNPRSGRHMRQQELPMSSGRRLLIGLSLWPGVKFHDIHFLTKDENIEESMQDDLFS